MHLYTINEASDILRIHRNTLQKLRDSGKIKSVVIGKKVLVSDEAIAEFIEAQTQKGK